MNKFILIAILILIIATMTGLFVFSDKIPFMTAFMDIIGISKNENSSLTNDGEYTKNAGNLGQNSNQKHTKELEEKANEAPTYSAFGSVTESLPTIDKSEINPKTTEGDPLVNCSSSECGEIVMKQSVCLMSVCCQVATDWQWLQDKESCEIAQSEAQSNDPIVNCQNPKCGEKTMHQSECTNAVCCETSTGWQWETSQSSCNDTQSVK